MKITWIIFLRVSGFISLGMLTTSLFMSPAFSQVPANNPNEMCGDGTTFTVNLPGQPLGIDDSDGIFRAVTVPPFGSPDSVTLPNGCSLYVLLVSGYNQNANFDRITFFKVADHVAKHNGYVHVAWWNNMLKEYMGGPLHPDTITILRFLPPETLDVTPNPGGYDPIQKQALLFPRAGGRDERPGRQDVPRGGAPHVGFTCGDSSSSFVTTPDQPRSSRTVPSDGWAGDA